MTGHRDSELVYVLQRRRRRLLVVNVASGELVNAVDIDSVNAEELIVYQGSLSRLSGGGPAFVDMHLLDAGKTLLSVNDYDAGFALHRFRLEGPRVKCR